MGVAHRLVLGLTVTIVVALIPLASLQSSPALAEPFGFTSVEVPNQPFEKTIGGFAKSRAREVRRLLRGMYWTLSRSLTKWGRWFRRALPFVLIALVAALADRGLVAAWRRDGLNVLATYVPMMLYVYFRLLWSRQVRVVGKLILLLAMLYAVKRRDLIIDRVAFPGLIDDVLLIVVATRVFLSTCPERLVAGFAEDALVWRRRITAFQRARRRGGPSQI